MYSVSTKITFKNCTNEHEAERNYLDFHEHARRVRAGCEHSWKKLPRRALVYFKLHLRLSTYT